MLKKISVMAFVVLPVLICGSAFADESDLFTSVAPDALIVLDLSGSMDWNPAGGSSVYGDSTCSGPFYGSSGTGHNTNCSRREIAKRAIFKLLDENGNGTIDGSDETSLNVRIGYMRFYDASSDDTGGSYSSGSNKLIWGIGTKYSRIYCNSATSCSITSGSSTSNCVNGESANGGTPLASSLGEAKLYLDAHKASDNSASCRQKFVILISDGADTFACNGNGTETQTDMYKRRRESVAKVKAMSDAGYKVFVIGFGSSMPDYLEKTLNWMAYYGGTDNPNIANSGSTSGYLLSGTNLYPSGVTSCYTETSSLIGTSPNYFAAANDPGNTSLSGYAFLASNATELSQSLKTAISIIRESNYSFSQVSVQSNRTTDENYLYEGSFEPVNNEPFWHGHLKKYQINNDGSIGNMLIDAGTVLQSKSAASRAIKTTLTANTDNSVLIDFNQTNVAGLLGVSSTVENSVIGFIRGDSTYNIENWKLGDIFRSNPITVGAPSPYFFDRRDTGTVKGYDQFKESKRNRTRVIFAAANDAQLHAFRTSDMDEVWSFVPPNLLPRLQNMAHATHPTLLTHNTYVDGSLAVWDIWTGTGSGRTKQESEWKTILVLGEGRGGGTTLWSSSPNCETGFSDNYDADDYPHYCGIYALDVTDTTNPVFKWRLEPTASQAPYLGDPWNNMKIGRIKDGANERWVGFVGAGYSGDCGSGSGCSNLKGKAFLVVDLNNGNIIWSYTYGSTGYESGATMDKSIPAPAAIVDRDNDGFIDTAYVGDLGANMWRFKFCSHDPNDTCGISNWSGGRLFKASAQDLRPIYTKPAAAFDTVGNFWVYWGTGDKMDPTAANAQEKFYAVKDNDRTSTYEISDLDNITMGVFDPASTKKGWYFNFSGSGEKMLADPVVFNGVVYFTTYTPNQSANVCSREGSASIFAVKYTTGGGLFSGGERSTGIGTGMGTTPVLSHNPYGGTNMFFTVSGTGGTGGSGTGGNGYVNPVQYTCTSGGACSSTLGYDINSMTNILYWKDRRLQ
jgi:Tfp pilus tip-associated adhesin PilY1